MNKFFDEINRVFEVYKNTRTQEPKNFSKIY